MAQFGRALRSGRRGRRFKSCHLDHKKNLNTFFIALRFFFYAIFNSFDNIILYHNVNYNHNTRKFTHNVTRKTGYQCDTRFSYIYLNQLKFHTVSIVHAVCTNINNKFAIFSNKVAILVIEFEHFLGDFECDSFLFA